MNALSNAFMNALPEKHLNVLLIALFTSGNGPQCRQKCIIFVCISKALVVVDFKQLRKHFTLVKLCENRAYTFAKTNFIAVLRNAPKFCEFFSSLGLLQYNAYISTVKYHFSSRAF